MSPVQAVFHSLAGSTLLDDDELGAGILLTGKGYPDLATRELLKRLSDELPSFVSIPPSTALSLYCSLTCPSDAQHAHLRPRRRGPPRPLYPVRLRTRLVPPVAQRAQPRRPARAVARRQGHRVGRARRRQGRAAAPHKGRQGQGAGHAEEGRTAR